MIHINTVQLTRGTDGRRDKRLLTIEEVKSSQNLVSKKGEIICFNQWLDHHFSLLGTLVFILWRPKGINEAIPAAIGALIVFLSGSVSFSDLGVITETISGAAITIMATIVMAIVLESFGFFNWVAVKLAEISKGSGVRLFWYVNLLCFLMTLFFNNDGSILITTPILVMLLNNMGLKNHQKFLIYFLEA